MDTFLKKAFKEKAQTEVISALLIIGITIAAVSVAYMWGVPIIQKGQSTNQITDAESMMNEIEKAISDVVQNGGQKTISLRIQGNFEILEDENTIKYTIITKMPGIARTEWVPMNEDETFGIAGTNQSQSIPIYGSDKDRVLIAKADVFGDAYTIDYKLVYREVDDLNNKNGYITSISAAGNNKASAGDIRLSISRLPPAILTATQSKLGGQITSTKVVLSIS